MRRRLVGWVVFAGLIATLAWGLNALVPALSGSIATGAATALLLFVVWVSNRFRARSNE